MTSTRHHLSHNPRILFCLPSAVGTGWCWGTGPHSTLCVCPCGLPCFLPPLGPLNLIPLPVCPLSPSYPFGTLMDFYILMKKRSRKRSWRKRAGLFCVFICFGLLFFWGVDVVFLKPAWRVGGVLKVFTWVACDVVGGSQGCSPSALGVGRDQHVRQAWRSACFLQSFLLPCQHCLISPRVEWAGGRARPFLHGWSSRVCVHPSLQYLPLWLSRPHLFLRAGVPVRLQLLLASAPGTALH